MHSCTYTLCLDQMPSAVAAQEEHHQCPAKEEGGRAGQGAGLDQQHSDNPPLDADELRRRRLLRFQQ